jgi:dihydrofolate reductase
MTRAKISLIAAMSENRVIGSRGKIPWYLPADFAHFRDITMGHPVIMGWKTFESIGKPLSGRTNIVITMQPDREIKGYRMAGTLDEALRLAGKAKGGGGEEIFVIGGALTYKEALPKADTIYLTKIHSIFEGDAFFPKFGGAEWRLAQSEFHKKDAENQYDYTFNIYERR